MFKRARKRRKWKYEGIGKVSVPEMQNKEETQQQQQQQRAKTEEFPERNGQERKGKRKNERTGI